MVVAHTGFEPVWASFAYSVYKSSRLDCRLDNQLGCMLKHTKVLYQNVA